MNNPVRNDEPPPAVYSAGVVARRLGIAPTTLRSWHSRYGLGPHAARPGTHRRYTEADVAVLETMARLVTQGVVPSAAAEIARRRGVIPLHPPAIQTLVRPGCRVARGLVSAATRLDAQSLCHVLDEEFATRGIDATWHELCLPALTVLGERVGPDGVCIDAVLLLSWAISAGLHRSAGPPLVRPGPRRALLACTDGERHTLGLEALHAALTSGGVPANMLGASVPASVLAAAATRTRPAVTVLWAQVRRTARPAMLRTLMPLADITLVAGPGWGDVRLPDDVVHVTGLSQAAEAVAAATGAPAPR